MFNVLIVDDKKPIRDGLKKYVDWQELGFHVAGDFSSAAEAIKFIETECVDILLTDIVMPGLSGLDLIKEVKLINPYIKVIILSAYEKFEYAQEAVNLGALYYLTKPVNLDKLKTEFRNVKLLLEKEKTERQQKKELNDFAKEQFLNNLVNRVYSSVENILKRADDINIQIANSKFCILRMVLEKSSGAGKELDEESFRLLKSMAISHLNECLNNLGRAYVFSSNLAEVSALFFPSEIDNLKNDMENYKTDLGISLNITAFIGVGKFYSNIMNVSDSYIEAGRALEYRIIKKHDNVLFYVDIASFFKGKSHITPEIEETILNYLSLNNETLLKDYILNIIVDAFKIGQSNPGILYDVCIEILLILNKFLTVNADIKKSIDKNDYFSIKSLLLKQNYREIEEFMMSYLGECISIIKNNNEESSGIIIENVKKYINEHYSENITLNTLSRIVYTNPVYLSRLFKDRTGENFIDYLTGVRVEHAKKLLEDLTLRIYDITEMVGYESRKHFGKTFKEITGMSPREYRDKLGACNFNPPK